MDLYLAKEGFLKQYLEATKQTITAVADDELELIEASLAKRDRLITQINQLDQQAGSIILNEEIQSLLVNIKALDDNLNAQFQKQRDEALNQLQSIQRGKQLKSQYEQEYDISDGVFYDHRE